MKDTTIAAIATFPAESAIGVIRISGKDAFNVAAAVFKPKKKPFRSIKPNYAVLGNIFDNNGNIDEAMLVMYRSPRSYTGEDMAEFSCHGSPYVLSRVMELLASNGCSPAGPGEFTKRAFLNGKMDLAEAEAVADIISAKNSSALRLAVSQLSGGESVVIKRLRSSLLSLLSLVEAEIDFAHEDIQKTTAPKAAGMAAGILSEITGLINSAGEGIMLRSGIKTAITGRPNAGKSSLLNAMLNKDRAIVTAAAGTTRDTVEGLLSTGGLTFRLIDTAGLRRARNQAEKHGIKKTEAALKAADIVILVLDGSKRPGLADMAASRRVKGKALIVAVNKCDLRNVITPEKAARFLGLKPHTPVIPVSAAAKHGINDLTKALKNIIMGSVKSGPAEAMIASLRHKKELESAKRSLGEAAGSLKKGSFEEAAFDLKRAADSLGSITGEISSDDILDKIFKNFCIGK